MSSTLKARREALKLRREDVASRAGISLRYVIKLEADECNPSLPVARRLAEALDASLDELFPADAFVPEVQQ